MNMKQLFQRLYHADDAALRQMGEYPAMDQTRREALYAKCEQKHCANQPDESASAESVHDFVIKQTQFRWQTFAAAAACLTICAAAAGAIGFLYRSAPEQTPVQQAELAPVTAAAPDTAEAVPAVTAETNAAAADVTAAEVFRETKAVPVMDVTEASTEATAEWLSYEDEVTLPGFRIEKNGESWQISTEQEHASFEQLYELQMLPEGAIRIGGDATELPLTGGFRCKEDYYRTAAADFDLCQYGRVEVSVNFAAAGNDGTAYTLLRPVTVAGHNGFLMVYKQCTEQQTFTEYEVGWDPGDRFCAIHAYTYSEEDLTETILQMAESAVLTKPDMQPAPAIQQSAEAPAGDVPEVTEAPTEAAEEWLTYEDEVTLPGFRIEKTGESWLITTEQKYASFEQPYELQFLPEGAVCTGSDTAEATLTSGFRGHEVYYRTADADYAFQQYGRIENFVSFMAAGNEGTAYTSLKPVTVAGHNGYLLVFRQCTEAQTLTEYQLGWDPGDRFCMIHAFTFTEEDLTETVLQMAESAVLTE